ncbi:carbohydrate ABC transporter permease [Kribbella sp. NPDC055110]
MSATLFLPHGYMIIPVFDLMQRLHLLNSLWSVIIVQAFARIMLPLSAPMLATVGMFTAITAWNSFFIPLVFTLGRPELRTLAIGMYAFIGENSTEWTLLCAGTVITLTPIILLFVLLQRFFVNGLAGAVKQ